MVLIAGQACDSSMESQLDEDSFQYGLGPFEVTVVGGTGSGVFGSGDRVVVQATYDGSQRRFVQWTGDSQVLPNSSQDTATFTMPAQSIKLIAHFEAIVPPKAKPSIEKLSRQYSGMQFDVVAGPKGLAHLISDRYYQIDKFGTVKVEETAVRDRAQYAMGFPPALAVSGDGRVRSAEPVLVASTDGGQSWTYLGGLGVTTDGGEGRLRPRLVAFNERFLLFYYDKVARKIKAVSIDMENVLF